MNLIHQLESEYCQADATVSSSYFYVSLWLFGLFTGSMDTDVIDI